MVNWAVASDGPLGAALGVGLTAIGIGVVDDD